jgi:hypothetical protein
MAKRTHVFKYVKTQDFKTSIISGLVGGFNGRGFLDINFFVETIDLPERVRHDVKEDGSVVNEPQQIAPKAETLSVREIPFAVSMDIRAAKSAVRWMQKQINEFEAKNPKITGSHEPEKE